MILVTVGSTLFPFPRMAKLVKNLAKANGSREKIIFQYGHTPPSNINKNIELYPFMSHENLMAYMRRARIIICHGGPATIYQALSFGKIPWVLPREKRFGEHVNDHQVDFGQFMNNRKYINIITKQTNIVKICTSSRTMKPLHHQSQKLVEFLDSLTEE
ncbi:glycosyltransferase [Candidatus Gottesmanbacteria bacterium]|nr:glycosyltransferase [Candidatus Gottesmanbacteria bacterium]